jgi:hypothetical protein
MCVLAYHVKHHMRASFAPMFYDMRIPTIVTTRSDASRPPVPIDRDQSDGAVRCIC